MKYSAKLKEKFGHHPEVKRILQHRHVPKYIYNNTKQNSVQINARKRRYSGYIINTVVVKQTRSDTTPYYFSIEKFVFLFTGKPTVVLTVSLVLFHSSLYQ